MWRTYLAEYIFIVSIHVKRLVGVQLDPDAQQAFSRPIGTWSKHNIADTLTISIEYCQKDGSVLGVLKTNTCNMGACEWL